MKFKHKKAMRAFIISLFTIILSLGAPIGAQDDQKKEEMEPVEELLVVTGSRIKRTDAEGAAPIDVITREEIAASGATSIDRILQELPSVTGGSLNTNISNGNDDRSTLRLRGLTPSNTLILLNGRRLALHGFPGGTNSSSSVDLNTIPLQAVERIEVFKDGGSAVYGSDAVAGVINIITRKNFDGFEIPLYYGQTSRGDLETQSYSFIYGTGTDRGRITISGNYYDQGVVWSRDRSISDDADARSLGGNNGRSSAPPNGRFTVDGNVLTFDPSLGDGSSTTHFVPYDFNTHGYNFAERTPAVIPQERSNIFLDGSWTVSENMEFFVEAHYVKIKTTNSLAPTPIFLRFEAQPITVSGQNRYNPFGVDIADVRRRMVEFENRVANYEGDNYRFVSGVKGTFADTWEWDTNFIWHEDKRTNFQTGALVHSRMVLATGPDAACQADPNCVPINLFGGPGSITPEMLDYVSTPGQFSGTSSMKIVGFNLAGNLGLLQGGPIGLAVGAEWREEQGADNPDSQTSLGNTIGFTNFEPTFGKRDITELYAEVNFPILNGVTGAEILEFNAAVRYSDYSDFGTNTSPKFGVRWQPINQVMIRATASEAFKAPTVGQLFSGSNESFPTLVDPFISNGIVTDDERTQFLTIFGGNSDLVPEESDVFTIGLVVEPFTNFSFTLDYFNLDQTNVVAANAQYILDENFRTGGAVFSDRIFRDADNRLINLVATPINVGSRKVTGYDFSFNYRMPEAAWGRWNFTLNGTYMDTWKEEAAPGAGFVSYVDFFNSNDGPGSVPRFKTNLITSVTQNNLYLGLTIRHIDDFDEQVGTLAREVDSWTVTDLIGTYTFPNLDMNVSLGIDNVTDEEPPFSAEAFNDNFDGRTHNLIGTFFFLNVTRRF